MLLLIVVVLILAIVLVLYRKMSKPHQYWKEKGIRYVKPWPLFGCMASNFFRIKAFATILQDLYNTFPEQRYFGTYQFLEPNLLIRDPELIKTILVKEFETFPEHRSMVNSDADPLWARSLITLKGEAWRDMRSTLSPAFTSSKMRIMFVLMKDIANQLTEHFLNESGTISIELKDVTSRYANDVILSTAFGITCNSFKNPENELYLKTKEITEFKTTRMLKYFGYAISPAVMRFLKFRMFEEETYEFYRNMVKQTIQIREAQGIIRPDMIHLLLEARKGNLEHEGSSEVPDSGFAVVEESEIGKNRTRRKTDITDDDITSQAFLFFFAGFETVSTAMSHLAYELALDKNIQERLRKEVDESYEECGGDITYEALLRMKYLDMVVSETLRKWPAAVMNDRVAVKPFTIEPKKVWEKPLTLEEGCMCLFPVYAIHRDRKNYPDPEKFDPERFNDENKVKINPYTYLPFGAGPRNCIGSRFALLEMKTFIFYLLCEFEIVTTDKTQNPLIISKTKYNPIPDKGFWVGLKPRHKKVA